VTQPLPTRTSGLAVAGLVCGIVGLCTCGLGAIAGIVLNVAALRRIARSHGHLGGKGLAVAGLVVSIATLVLGLILGGGAAIYVIHGPLGDQVREILENAKKADDDSEFIAEPKEQLGLPYLSLTGPHLWPA